MANVNFLCDTSIVIGALHGNKKAQSFLNKLSTAAISVMSQAELLEGSRNKKELQDIRNAVRNFSILYPNKEIFTQAIFYLENHFLKHDILFDDALIAATSVEHNLTLATTEKKHFKPIKNLKLHYPY